MSDEKIRPELGAPAPADDAQAATSRPADAGRKPGTILTPWRGRWVARTAVVNGEPWSRTPPEVRDAALRRHADMKNNTRREGSGELPARDGCPNHGRSYHLETCAVCRAFAAQDMASPKRQARALTVTIRGADGSEQAVTAPGDEVRR